jgi:hypothetical protein
MQWRKGRTETNIGIHPEVRGQRRGGRIDCDFSLAKAWDAVDKTVSEHGEEIS